MRTQVDPMFLSMFANGDYDFLYEDGERERLSEAQQALPPKAEVYRLSDDRHFVVVQKLTKRTGVVVDSNLLPKGAEVRSRVNWPFAVKPRNGWGAATLVAPRTLEVLSVPRRAAA